jgi:hypothetical protein
MKTITTFGAARLTNQDSNCESNTYFLNRKLNLIVNRKTHNQ